MKRKGIKFKRAPHLTWRNPQKGDLDDQGRQIEGAYMVIVRVKDCLDENGDFSHELLEKAPQHGRLAHSRTNMAYGPYRKINRRKGFWVQVRPHLTPAQYKEAERELELNGTPIPRSEEWQEFEHYWSCPIYWVENGQVYQASASRYRDPALKYAKAA